MFNLRLDVYHHFSNPLESPASLLERLNTMSAQLDALTAQVAATNTVMASAATLIQGLAAEVAAVKAELAQQGIDNARLNELAADLDAGDDALAAAVAANTPAAPTE